MTAVMKGTAKDDKKKAALKTASESMKEAQDFLKSASVRLGLCLKESRPEVVAADLPHVQDDAEAAAKLIKAVLKKGAW